MRTRRPVVMADYLGDEPTTASAAADDAAEQDLQARVTEAESAGAELDARESEARTIREVGDVLEHLHRIVEEVAADDDVAESTNTIIREVANRELSRVNARLSDAPTTESWHTPKERLMLSTESIGETLKKLWDKLKEVAQRVYDALVKFVEGFIGILESALRMVKELQKDLPGMNWASAEPVTSAKAKYLSVNNRLDANWPKDILGTVKAVGEADNEIFDLVKTVSDGYIGDFNKAMDAKKIEATWNDQAQRCVVLFRALRTKLAGIVTTPPRKPTAGNNGTLVYTSGTLPGEYRIKAVLPGENLQGAQFMVAFETAINTPGGIEREPHPQNAAKPPIEILPAVSKDVVKSAVDGLVSELENLIGQQKSHEVAIDDLNKKLKRIDNQMLAPLMSEDLPVEGKHLLLILAKMANLPAVMARPMNKYLLELVPHYVGALKDTVKAYS